MDRGLGEGRQHFRTSRKVRWPVDFEVIGRVPDIEPGRQTAETRGVSLGGAFIAHLWPPPVETDLHLWLFPHQPAAGRGSALRLRAQVRWINEAAGALPVGFGVQFRALTAADEVILHSSFSRSAKVV
ncbi:MAG: PilZ domain-containing protein [Myxococcota bacterium]